MRITEIRLLQIFLFYHRALLTSSMQETAMLGATGVEVLFSVEDK